jgi:hypothetical protein
MYARIATVIATVALCQAPARQVVGAPLNLTEHGWTISADAETKTLTVRHERIGVLLEGVLLQIPGPKGLTRAERWTVLAAPHEVSVMTEGPRAHWILAPRANSLRISCTSSDAIIRATIPAGKDRLVARLLDTDGVPVTWSGTGEVAGTYGGSYTRNPSALPSSNPECSYFTLGAVSASVFHSVFDRASDSAIRFPNQAVLRRTADKDQSLELTLPVPGNALVRLFPDYYLRQLGLPCYAAIDDSYFHAAPMVWGSWTSCYSDVTEADIVRNTDWISQHLKPYGFQYVQLDDGYDSGGSHGHNWIDSWDAKKFPHGPQWLAAYIRSKGLHPGLWIVPNAYAGGVDEHPGWYLRDKNGKIVLDYGTPALDCTNPQVQEFLKKMFGAG